MRETSQLAQFREKLNLSFDKSELRTLCFDLGIDYDNLPETKTDAVRELLRSMAGQRRLDALVTYCRAVRPQVSWPDIPAAEVEMFLRQPVLHTLSKQEVEERQKQLVLLNKVKRFWIKGVLERAVPEAETILINQQSLSMSIEHQWHEVVGTAVYDNLSLVVHPSILDTFKEADRALLILGEPGSGKTITLLKLVQHLIELAEIDPLQPIPVVLNLSSWAERKNALSDWVIEELIAKYQIPRQVSRSWLQNDNLILLLDGLDEVPTRERDDCVAAVNQFRLEHGLTGLVVSSRIDDYLNIGIKLKLGGAILLQSLTLQQVDDYLLAAGPPLASLRTAIQHDSILQEMARSPLLLNVMRLAYYNFDENLWLVLQEANEEQGAVPTHQQHLFNTFIQRMFERRGNKSHYSQLHTKKWLSWLAQRMTSHSQAVFLIEQIQPSWLPSSHFWLWFYVMLSRLLGGFIIGIIMWLFILLGEQNIPQFSVGLFTWSDSLFGLSPKLHNFVSVIIVNLGLGFIVGVIDGLHFEHRRPRHDEGQIDRKQGWQHLIIVGSVVSLLTFGVMSLFDPLLLAVFASLMEALCYCFAFGYVDQGQSLRTEIRAVEALSWSWRGALSGLIPGFFGALVAGGAMGLQYGRHIGLVFAINFGIAFFLLGGLRRNRLEEKVRPNQGIWLSVRNGGMATLLFGGVLGLVLGLWLGLPSGLIMTAIFGLIGALLYGGVEVLKHTGLRIALWAIGHMPLHYSHFLDHAAKHIFLHKVGGGYIFVHRLLQEHFTRMEVS